MNLVVHREGNMMSIDNEAIEFDVSDLLEPNMELVSWNGTSVTGRIEYNDRLRIMEPFRDLLGDDPPAPSLVPLIDAWLIAARDTLTLDQARSIKANVVSDICTSKQRSPYSQSGREYEADDETLLQAMMSMVPEAFNYTGGAGSALVSAINNRLGTITSNFNVVNAAVGVTNTHASTISQSLQRATAMPGSVASAGLSGGVPECSQVGTVTGIAASGISGAETAMVPWETTDFVSRRLTPSEAGTIMLGILQRNADLSIVMTNKLDEIDQLPDIAAVIAYDVAQGW